MVILVKLRGYGDQKDMGIKKMDLMNRPIKDVVKFSNTIAWYKEDCEICGQGSFLCDDSRCPINSSISFYDKKKEETIKMRANRGIIKRLAAMILNEDDKTISR